MRLIKFLSISSLVLALSSFAYSADNENAAAWDYINTVLQQPDMEGHGIDIFDYAVLDTLYDSPDFVHYEQRQSRALFKASNGIESIHSVLEKLKSGEQITAGRHWLGANYASTNLSRLFYEETDVFVTALQEAVNKLKASGKRFLGKSFFVSGYRVAAGDWRPTAADMTKFFPREDWEYMQAILNDLQAFANAYYAQ